MTMPATPEHIELPLTIEEAGTFWSRFLGLMFRKELPKDKGLHIAPCNSIHMMFMKFSIDVVFLDRDGNVVKLRERVRPWVGMVGPVSGAFSVLELPIGSIRKFNIRPGVKVTWKS